MYSNPTISNLAKLVNDQAEIDRLEAERRENILRLIGYNNRRVLCGLRPLEIPEKLGYSSGWSKPINRDNIKLETR